LHPFPVFGPELTFSIHDNVQITYAVVEVRIYLYLTQLGHVAFPPSDTAITLMTPRFGSGCHRWADTLIESYTQQIAETKQVLENIEAINIPHSHDAAPANR
jgi:hypothetical protein